jgi:hypothetical protein
MLSGNVFTRSEQLTTTLPPTSVKGNSTRRSLTRLPHPEAASVVVTELRLAWELIELRFSIE